MTKSPIEIVEGYLITSPYRSVPDVIWSRLRSLIVKAHRYEEYEADRLQSARGDSLPWAREECLFMRWTRRVYGEPDIWPWSRGWTDERLATYLRDKEPTP